MIDLRPYFPHAKVLREQDGDIMLCDSELSPHCGFMSMKEANILHEVAIKYPGLWCEIGSHVGWSAAYIAHAGCRVAAVDLEYNPGNPILNRAMENWRRMADALAATAFVRPFGASSYYFFAENFLTTFNGIHIDGNHDAPEPLKDAITARIFLATHGVIVFHDYNGAPVKMAVDWLRDFQGFKVTIHNTMNGMAVCER